MVSSSGLLAILTLVFAVSVPVSAAAKDARAATPPPSDLAALRQGGDTIADAVVVDLPYSGTGTTVGYTDDYDEACPYDGSTSPDVVYTFAYAGGAASIDIDLCGSSYDTKVYVYDADLALVGCNDDYYFDDICGTYVSRIEALVVPAGTYHVVVDGYGGDAGEYQISIEPWGTPWIACPPGAEEEGEPPLVDGYLDAHNGGCDALGDVGAAILQPLAGPVFCGRSGWYLRDGDLHRDHDWYRLTLPATGELEITAQSNLALVYAEMGPTDCDQVSVVQAMVLQPLEVGSLTLEGTPGAEVWLRVEPASAEGFGEDVYVLHLPGVVAVEPVSWSEIRRLYH